MRLAKQNVIAMLAIVFMALPSLAIERGFNPKPEDSVKNAKIQKAEKELKAKQAAEKKAAADAAANQGAADYRSPSMDPNAGAGQNANSRSSSLDTPATQDSTTK